MKWNEEKSLPEKLSEDVIQYILEKKLEPGDRLPKESELSEALGAGRSSIREAMKLLASRNIVTIRQGSGTYVARTPGVVEDPLGFTFIQDKRKLTQDLLEIRILIEPPIAAMAAARADEADVRLILQLCEETEALIRAGKDHTQKDLLFHQAIAMSSKNLVVPRLIPVINSSIPLFIQLTGNALVDETIHTHRDLANAIASHDSIRAQDSMYLHLIYNRNRLSQQAGSPK